MAVLVRVGWGFHAQLCRSQFRGKEVVNISLGEARSILDQWHPISCDYNPPGNYQSEQMGGIFDCSVAAGWLLPAVFLHWPPVGKNHPTATLVTLLRKQFPYPGLFPSKLTRSPSLQIRTQEAVGG